MTVFVEVTGNETGSPVPFVPGTVFDCREAGTGTATECDSPVVQTTAFCRPDSLLKEQMKSGPALEVFALGRGW